MAQSLKVSIIGDASSYAKALNQASGHTDSFGKSLARLGKVALVAAGAAGLGAAFVTLKRGFAEVAESQKVMAQTEAVLKSTGAAANVSAEQVSALATSLSEMSGADDEAVQAGENMLLTFTNIQNEVGKGNDIFNQATKATLDMATAMNQGAVPSSEQMAKQSILVGKALNDPIRGMTALRRVGVSFTEGQIKTIKALVESGKTMEAQKLILKELNKEFGGSAEAAGKTFPGQLNKLRNAFDELAGGIAGALVPALSRAMGGLTKFFQRLSAASGIRAKIKVTVDAVWTIAKNTYTALRKQINDLLFGQFTKGGGVGPEGIKFSPGLVAQFRDGLAALDWSSVGQSIIDGITNTLQTAGDFAKKLATTIQNAISQVDWVNVGKVIGPGLAAAIAAAFVTLTDPGFWVKNWELLLAVAIVAFPAARLGGKIGELLTKAFGESFGKAAIAIGQRFSALLGTALGAVEGIVRGLFGRLGAIAVFALKVTGIDIAINAIADFVGRVGAFFRELGGTIGGALNTAWEEIKIAAIKTALAVVEPFSHLPGAFGGWARSAKNSMQGELDKIEFNRVTRKLEAQAAEFQKAGRITAAAAAEGWMNVLPPAGARAGKAAATALGNQTGAAHAGGVAVGAAAAQGVAAGIYGWMPVAIAAGITMVNNVILSMRSAAEAHSPSEKTKLLGKDLADGIVIGFASAMATRASEFAAPLQKAAQKMAAAIPGMRKALVDAFQKMADDILAAFDERVAAWKPPSLKLLEKMQLEDQINSAVKAVADAQTKIDAAIAARAALTRTEGESDAEFAARIAQADADIKSATEELGAAQRSYTEMQLQLTAAQEQAAHDKQMAADRKHLAARLKLLGEELPKNAAEYDKAQKEILALLKKYNVPMHKVGKGLAEALGKGLDQGIQSVINAAKKLAAALEQITGPVGGAGAGGGTRATTGTSAFRPSGGTTVNVTVHGSVLTPTDLVDAVHTGLLRKQQRNGNLGLA